MRLGVLRVGADRIAQIDRRATQIALLERLVGRRQVVGVGAASGQQADLAHQRDPQDKPVQCNFGCLPGTLPQATIAGALLAGHRTAQALPACPHQRQAGRDLAWPPLTLSISWPGHVPWPDPTTNWPSVHWPSAWTARTHPTMTHPTYLMGNGANETDPPPGFCTSCRMPRYRKVSAGWIKPGHDEPRKNRR